MNRRKSNISAWYLTGLTALLLAGCVMLSIPAAFARYREETTQDVALQVRNPARVYLWAGSDPAADYFPGTGSWYLRDGVPELSFMVTNTKDAQDIPKATQEYRVRLIASLGAWDGASEIKIRLTTLSEEHTDIYYAQAKPIRKDTPLYQQFGEGWYFTFLDEDGEEIRWTLEGGSRSTISMQLALEVAQITDTSLMQLQVIGEMTDD